MCFILMETFKNIMKMIFFMSISDLREDRGYLADHMGSNVIISSQVNIFPLLKPELSMHFGIKRSLSSMLMKLG